MLFKSLLIKSIIIFIPTCSKSKNYNYIWYYNYIITFSTILGTLSTIFKNSSLYRAVKISHLFYKKLNKLSPYYLFFS